MLESELLDHHGVSSEALTSHISALTLKPCVIFEVNVFQYFINRVLFGNVTVRLVFVEYLR